jgi:hypothetical protein
LHVFQITLEAMKSSIDEVALQGIEFWSTVCDEEVDLAIEAAEVQFADLQCCFLLTARDVEFSSFQESSQLLNNF